MTDMNPLRDNELAAQERVIQLERELAERDMLIYKLQNPQKEKKVKPPRKPINWPAWFTKAAKISAAVVGGAVLLLFCISFFEHNETYVTKGKITRVLAKAHKYKGACSLVPNERGRLYRPYWCEEQEIAETSYDIEVEFIFQKEKRTARFKPFELTMGDGYRSWSETAENPLIIRTYRTYFGEAVPHVGCIVNVYYPLGVVFKDRTWPPKFLIDASMCKEPEKKESKKAEEPPRTKEPPKNVDDGRRPNRTIECSTAE